MIQYYGFQDLLQSQDTAGAALHCLEQSHILPDGEILKLRNLGPFQLPQWPINRLYEHCLYSKYHSAPSRTVHTAVTVLVQRTAMGKSLFHHPRAKQRDE